MEGDFERLHGHNFLISAEVEGEEKGGLVMDFRELEGIMEKVASALDHKVLVPQNNPLLKVSCSGGYLEMLAARKRYRIPEGDAILLPLKNSTAEEVGRYIYGRVAENLPAGLKLNLVSVQETDGKAAMIDSPG
jgi:6-pyruvoyltetrahydropterin/6-carboxytetrahydropterin synthase